MANILVTGGAGFIGGNFVHYWAKHHPDDAIIILDSLTYAGNVSTVSNVEQAELIIGDIRDTAQVTKLLAQRDISIIVHFAAESHVDRSIDGPAAFVQTNVVGTLSLLEQARDYWRSLDCDAALAFRFTPGSGSEAGRCSCANGCFPRRRRRAVSGM